MSIGPESSKSGKIANNSQLSHGKYTTTSKSSKTFIGPNPKMKSKKNSTAIYNAAKACEDINSAIGSSGSFNKKSTNNYGLGSTISDNTGISNLKKQPSGNMHQNVQSASS